MDYLKDDFKWGPEEAARYTAPQEINLGSVPGVVVDPHNEAFGYWQKYLTGKKAVLFHIDHHADMGSGSMSLESARHFIPQLDYYTYGKKFLNMQSFISAALHYDFFEGVYWYDPRNKSIADYGKPKTIVDTRGNIQWVLPTSVESVPKYTQISPDQFIQRMQQQQLPVLLDIDLDAFECVTDDGYRPPTPRWERWKETSSQTNLKISELKDINIDVTQIELPMDTVETLLSQLTRPIGISIALSQTPRIYTPPESVRRLRDDLVTRLTSLYS